MMSHQQMALEALVHAAGMTRQSAAARFFDGRFRFGGPRIFHGKRFDVKPANREYTSTLTQKERSWYGKLR